MKLRHGRRGDRRGHRRAGCDLLVVTENGYGKRTRVTEYQASAAAASA